MPYVDAADALNKPVLDLAALTADRGSGEWRERLVADTGTRWVLLSWEPGFRTVPHRHPRASEVFLVLEGRLGIRLGDTPEVEAGPGTILMARQDEVHGLRVVGDQRLLIIASVSPNESAPDETIEIPEATA
jgi:mannose-6-phosphate isomerase-like protein (cupin superfamily)